MERIAKDREKQPGTEMTERKEHRQADRNQTDRGIKHRAWMVPHLMQGGDCPPEAVARPRPALNFGSLRKLSSQAMDARRELLQQHDLLPEPLQSAAILRGSLRSGDEAAAVNMLDEELSIPEEVSGG